MRHNRQVWFAVLGSVEARSAAGHPVPLGGPRSRSLLALLLLDAGRVVSTDRLIDGLYGDAPPGDTVNALQAQVSRLRRKLGDEAQIESQPAGYRLVVEPDRVDLNRFIRLTREGREALAADEHVRAAKLLREALALWRGPALADVREAPIAEAHATRLDELRTVAIEDRAEADLALGESRGVIGAFPSAGAASDPVGRIDVALAGRRMLLIFDNCEHVIADAAKLAHRLLGSSPGLRVLATSREPLGITGEALCPVSPLASPPPGSSAAEAGQYDSVRLFTDRAAAVRPGFHLDDDSAGQVLRICAALDGLPLAIELAAARLRTLPLDQLEARLGDRFRLLSKGSRTAAPRHQTLRAVVGWSWDLLEPDEQDLAERFAVFAGGATAGAVAGVCGLSEPDAEDLLDSLVDKSLLELAGDRYRMLETIRAFSAERLDESGERDEVARAHAEYFLALARTADSHLRRTEQIEWLARLTAERPNLHSALRWVVDSDTGLALRLVGALSSYWRLQGVRTEIAPLAGRLLANLGPEPPGDLAEEYALCVLNAVPAEPPGLDEHLRRVGTIMTSLRWPLRQPYLLVYWALFAGPPDPTRQPNELEQAVFDDDDPWLQALRDFSTSYLRLFNGDTEGAEAAFGSSLERFREVGDRWGIAQVLDGLAELADLRGDRDRSQALVDEAMDLLGQLNATEELAEVWLRRADRLLRDGDLTDAEAGYHRAADLARRAGASMVLAQTYRGFGELARRHGDFGDARAHYGWALDALGPDWQSDAASAQTLTALGRLAEATGDLDEARRRHRRALDITLKQHFRANIAAALEGLAGITLLDGDAEEAAEQLGMAVALRGVARPGDRDVAGVAAACQKLLGADAFATAYYRGAAMPYDQIRKRLTRRT